MRYHENMPDKRTHRGPHPEDAKLFTETTQPDLAHAVDDMSWLLSRGYADKSTLKLVGDRFNLTQRQRLAVMRCSCSDTQLNYRVKHQVSSKTLANQPLLLDGYNVLITAEAALAGGVLFLARDGCIRDLASIHGTYRKVSETLPAIDLIAKSMQALSVLEITWFLDKPVSNSGRLKQLILEYSESHHLAWDVQLVLNPDKVLVNTDRIIVTSDSIILDNCIRWFNLNRWIVENQQTDQKIRLLDLASPVNCSF